MKMYTCKYKKRRQKYYKSFVNSMLTSLDYGNIQYSNYSYSYKYWLYVQVTNKYWLCSSNKQLCCTCLKFWKPETEQMFDDTDIS